MLTMIIIDIIIIYLRVIILSYDYTCTDYDFFFN